MPDKESQQDYSQQRFQPIQTTGQSNYDISQQGSAGIRDCISSLHTSITPQEQTTEEWLADYERRPTNVVQLRQALR